MYLSVWPDCSGGVFLPRGDNLKLPFVTVDLVDMIGNSSHIDTLSRLLHQSEQRHKVVSQNIANINTPGYKSMEAKFPTVLAGASESGTTSTDHNMMLVRASGGVEREDGNNVDLDQEMGNLTRNSIEFETFTHLLVARISQFRSAIAGQ